MIVQKPADLNPAMKSALKNHIMRKRQQLKQELEQDAIEKRLKREQEAKRKQDAMTLDQLKDQLSHLEKKSENLKGEKHSLFTQLKKNMRVLDEGDTKRKQKEGELNAARQQQQNEQNRQQLQQQNQLPNQQQTQQQQTVSNGSLQHSSVSNQENHMPISRDKSNDIPAQPPHLYHQQANHHEQDTPQTNSHQLSQPTSHIQRPNSIFNSAAAFSHLLNAHSFPRHSSYLTHLPPSNRSSNPYAPMNSYPALGHHPPPSLISGHGIPTSIPHVPQSNTMIRPSPPPMSNNSGQLNSGPSKLSMSLPITSSGPPTSMDFNPNLANSTAHQMQQQAMNNSAAAAAAAAALGIPYGPPYFNSNNPIGPPPHHQPLEHHTALNAAAAAAAVHNHISGNGNNQSNSGNNNNINGASNSSHGNSLPPMKRPISATSLANDALSPNKKVHTQPPPPQNIQHQLPASLSNPYLAYSGLPPGLNSPSGPSLPTNLYGPSLIRTPPPPNISSLFNSAAFSHLLNAHSFPRHSSYLTHLPPSNRSSNPYAPMNSYPALGHHPPPSLISGHGIPTSIPHVPQSNTMIRPSPPPMSNNSGQLNSGPSKLSMSLPITSSGPPTSMDFNPNLANSTAHQMQQQAMNNSAAAAAAAAALGIPYGPPYFNSNNPIGPPITSHQALEQHALNAAAAAAAAASAHNILSSNSNNPNSSTNNNIKSRVAPYQ